MRAVTFSILACAVALSGCSTAEEQAGEVQRATVDMAESAAPESEYAFAEEAADASADSVESAADTGSAPIPVSVPQIAYTYTYGFRIAADAIAPLQQNHADLCEDKGPDVCRIISMEQSGSEGDYGYGRLVLAVASKDARAFGAQLNGSAESMDGEQVSLSISGEDLSKSIVDTEARLRSRTLLRDRLMDILRSRNGSVAELVEAERGVAQVNEEIDQASSWLAEMKGRVAFSEVTINYNSGSRSSGSFTGPIAEAFSSIGAILGTTIAAIIIGLTILVPLLLLFFALRWLWRRSGLSFRNTRPAKDARTDAETEPAKE